MAGSKRWYLIMACVLAGSLVLAGMTLGARARPSVYVLSIDGETLGVVSDPGKVSRCVEDILSEARNVWPADLEVSSRIECVPYKKGESDVQDTTPLTPDVLTRRLGDILDFSAGAFVVQVEGRDIAALRDRAAAEWVIEEIRQAYLGKPGNGAANVRVEQVRILQQVDIVEKKVPVDSLREPEEAKQILLRGTDRVALYTVSRGDSLWAIARSRGMTVEDLRKANPQIAGDRLQVGQTLNLIVPEPYVNVVSVETVTQEIVIPFQVSVSYDDTRWPWEQIITKRGAPGRKEVVMEISKKDGREVQRRIMSEKVLEEPVTQTVVQGSKVIPDLGTGSYAWPTQGSISSRYGHRRSGFHYGLDIAAPTGTPVVAADSGMVAYAGRLPYYGLVVRIDHGSGKAVTVYGHLSRIGVKQGQTVSRGQVIGNVGSTGRSTGPHLHFEVRLDGVATDPLKLYPATGK
ncbi:MAG: peptidoglycan DD-metalloendopeptidase family protein [Ignavibacteriales bacterium]